MKNKTALLLLCLSCTLLSTILTAAVAQVGAGTALSGSAVIDTSNPLVKSYWGAGVQWDPSDIFDYTDDQWQTTYKWVDFMHPGFIRCCTTSYAYCDGFDASGSPLYQWTSPIMLRLYRILDYCQSHNVRVVLGEWIPRKGLAVDDPRWDVLLGALFDHLVNGMHYTCVMAVQKYNEPWINNLEGFQHWAAAQNGVYAALKREGLADRVAVAVPDRSTDDSSDPFIGWTAEYLYNIVGVYESHLCASISDIESGSVTNSLQGFRATVNKFDPNGSNLPYVLTEAGTNTWIGPGIDFRLSNR